MLTHADVLNQDLEEERIAARESLEYVVRYLSACSPPNTRYRLAWLLRQRADAIEAEVRADIMNRAAG